MKNGQVITLLCAIAISLVAATSANVGLAVLYSTPKDLPNLPHTECFTRIFTPNEKITGAAWDMPDACAETTPSMDQTNLEFKIKPDCNDYPDDMTPAINTETWTPAYHHSP